MHFFSWRKYLVKYALCSPEGTIGWPSVYLSVCPLKSGFQGTSITIQSTLKLVYVNSKLELCWLCTSFFCQILSLPKLVCDMCLGQHICLDIPGPEAIKLFLCSTQLNIKFIMLINIKMPTVVGILTFNSLINTTFESLKARKVFIFKHSSCNEHLKIYAQLSWTWKKFYNLGAWALQRKSIFPIFPLFPSPIGQILQMTGSLRCWRRANHPCNHPRTCTHNLSLNGICVKMLEESEWFCNFLLSTLKWVHWV